MKFSFCREHSTPSRLSSTEQRWSEASIRRRLAKSISTSRFSRMLPRYYYCYIRLQQHNLSFGDNNADRISPSSFFIMLLYVWNDWNRIVNACVCVGM